MTESPSRKFKFRPNPMRQIAFGVLALTGVAVGYGLGFFFKPGPKELPPGAASTTAKKTAPVAQTNDPADEQESEPLVAMANVVLPENTTPEKGPVRAYEEALPKEIVVTVERLGQQPSPAPSAPPLNKPKETAHDGVEVGKPETMPPKTTPSTPAPTESSTDVPNAAPRATLTAEPEITNQSSQPSQPPPVSAIAAPAISPAAPEEDKTLPWRRYAVAANPDGRPMIAIVIDDLGIDRPRTRRAIALKGPLSMSFLTYGAKLADQTAEARAAGHELWMHVPMEPSAKNVDPGPNVLLTGFNGTELLNNLRWNLDQFGHYVGINNHMGSRFTADTDGMRRVMGELKTRGLAFLDSVTSGRSAGGREAANAGVPFAMRNVFIDHEDDIKVIRSQLAKIEKLARKQGHAIAIGHPREATLKALSPWLEDIENKGFKLVPVSALLHQKPTETAAKPSQ